VRVMHILTKATFAIFALLLLVDGSNSYAQRKRVTMQEKQEFLNAVKAGDETEVRELLKTNAELAKTKDEKGVSAVLQAVYNGHDKIAQLLIASGVKLDIFEASATGTTERIRELLKRKPDLVSGFSPDGFTPLGLASFFGHLDTVRLLLDKGAKIDVPSNNFLKAVPLRSASVAGHLEIARLLIDRGADVNAVGEGGETPLHEVAGVGRVEFAKLLLDHGANINARGDNRKTPLTVAIENKKLEMAEFLRSKGGVQ
jgi:uncharacterized protein